MSETTCPACGVVRRLPNMIVSGEMWRFANALDAPASPPGSETTGIGISYSDPRARGWFGGVGTATPAETHRELIRLLTAEGVDLCRPRRLTHYLHVESEQGAKWLAKRLRGAGFVLEQVADDSDHGRWLLFALEEVVVSAEALERSHTRMDELLRPVDGVQLGILVSLAPASESRTLTVYADVVADRVDPFERLLGERLSSIEFVLNDYVQLRFDGPTLTAYNWPTVAIGATTVGWGEPGYRDALCERICATLRSAHVTDDEIALSFSDNSVLTISTRAADTVGPEAAELIEDDRHWVFQV